MKISAAKENIVTKITEVPSPALYVELDIFERNTRRLMEAAKRHNLAVRPHVKAHKSAFLAKKQMEAGACGLTCAKLSEAEAFADAGFEDILVAFPLYGKEKWERYAALNRRIALCTTIDSIEIARGLSEACRDKTARVLVEIDCGTLRCGVAPEVAGDLAARAARLPGIEIAGVFSYNGLIYSCHADEERRASAKAEMDAINTAAEALNAAGIETSVKSGGNSRSFFVLDALSGMTEVRPGNAYFNDVAAINAVNAREEDCSMRVLATVVSLPGQGRATIDAGTKTFTGDLVAGKKIMGRIGGMPDVEFQKANEEHGFLIFDYRERNFRVGDRVTVIPNHACVLPNLCDGIYGVRAGEVERKFPVEARGCNY